MNMDNFENWLIARSPAPLTKEECSNLARKWRETRDPKIRDRMIAGNIRLVGKIVGEMRLDHCQTSDMISEGIKGLVKAVEKYNPDMASFSTYANWWILHYIERAKPNYNSTINMPSQSRYEIKRIKSFCEEYYETEGEYPSVGEISDGTQISSSKTLALQFGRLSFDSMDEARDENGFPLKETVADKNAAEPSDLLNKKEVNQLLKELFDETLSDREAKILRMRFGLDDGIGRTLEETSQTFAFTRERVRQLQKSAMEKLKEFFANGDVGKYEDLVFQNILK